LVLGQVKRMSRLVKTMITSLAILLVGGGIAVVVIANVTGQSIFGEKDSIEQMVKYSYETSEITTDLSDGTFVKIQFQILTDGKKAHSELTHRDFQIKNIIIKELSPMTQDDFKTSLADIEKNLQNKLNELMTEGEIIDVYTINKISQ